MFRAIAAPAVALVAVLGLAACSSGDSGGPDSAFCKQAKEYRDQGESLFPTGATDSEKYQATLDGLRKLEQSAPKDIKQDIQVFIQAAEKLQSGDLQGLTDPEFSGKLQAAAQNVEQYNSKVCKIEPPESLPE